MDADRVAEYERRKEETVKKIMEKKKSEGDYYSILEVPTDCSAEDVKRAFLKLSLLVHPDKNKSPDATEAFKHVLDACHRLKKLKLSSSSDEEDSSDEEEEKPEAPEEEDDIEEEKPEAPEGWERCLFCGKFGDNKYGVRRFYCSLFCVRDYLASRRQII